MNNPKYKLGQRIYGFEFPEQGLYTLIIGRIIVTETQVFYAAWSDDFSSYLGRGREYSEDRVFDNLDDALNSIEKEIYIEAAHTVKIIREQTFASAAKGEKS